MRRALTFALRGAAVGGILVLTGSAALAGMTYTDMQGPRAWNSGQSYRGGYTVYPNGIWNGRVYDVPVRGGSFPQFGKFSASVAREQLNALGYSNVHGLKPTHGWIAHAFKNGQQVKVMLDNENDVSTYTGK